jgi:branched-chain amino acid transport system permease protein
MLVTFGIMVLIESLIQWYWTADYRKFESEYSNISIHIGPLFVPALELSAFITAVFLSLGMWFWLQKTLVGKALRASAHDAEMAAAFGVNGSQLSYLLAGICAAFSGVAGIFIALISTLSPAQIENWIGVVFAVVIIGGLANPIGALAAGVLIGVAESTAMVFFNPAWSPLIAFSILIALLVWRPRWL